MPPNLPLPLHSILVQALLLPPVLPILLLSMLVQALLPPPVLLPPLLSMLVQALLLLLIPTPLPQPYCFLQDSSQHFSQINQPYH